MKKLEDIAAVLKTFLSQRLPTESMLTYKTYLAKHSDPSGVYYIYDSSVPDSVAESSDMLTVIDADDTQEK